MNGKKIIFIDIDDTLVRTYGLKRIPIGKTIQAIFRFHKEGSEIYLWSNGGSDYCKKTAKELGIDKCITGFLPKPTLYIDDMPTSDWKFCQHIYPGQIDLF